MWTKEQKKTLTKVMEGLHTLNLRIETLAQIIKLLDDERDYKTEQKIKNLQEIIKTQKDIMDVMCECKDKLEVVKAKKSIVDVLNESKG